MSEQKEDKESWGKFVLDVAIIWTVLMGIFFLLFHFVLSNDTVSGSSMQPNFENGQHLISVRHAEIKRGEVVIVKAPDEPGALYIKRVIGLPGEKIVSKNNQIYINGKRLAQPWLTKGRKMTDMGSDTDFSATQNFTMVSLARSRQFQQYYTQSQLSYINKYNRIPKGTYFVMGDHRSISKDSRYIGTIKRKNIIGVVKLRYWPFNEMKIY
ncbi:signal peptidase I [Lactobacillus ultunensis]|uniref:signal peptidase I n=1 Tax=Lactobacillus ultunensis TaxID=227945 RepID=UPI001913F25D|nr:signal peptidase I [Lactobacillus ultunensis]QQP28467.1 signal peptidase I [Lactobacillus ultunensis]